MAKRILRQDSIEKSGFGAEQKCMNWQQEQLVKEFANNSNNRCGFIFKQLDDSCVVTLLVFKDSADMIAELHTIEEVANVDFRHQD